ncbi:IS66 family transposase, partial [Dethiosulfovibrio salsuginis]
EILLYARDFAIPFDNNEAERNIRNFKAKLKISGCFRTSEGANDYAKIMSFLITAKKNSINIFEPMSMALDGQILFLDGATE